MAKILSMHRTNNAKEIITKLRENAAKFISNIQQKDPVEGALFEDWLSGKTLLWRNGTQSGMSILFDDHIEHYLLNDLQCHQRLHAEYTRIEKVSPSAARIQALVKNFTAEALLDGEEVETFYGVGRSGEKVYYDLANDNWEVIECTAEGWKITKHVDIIFIRKPEALSQCLPERGGAISEFEAFLNVDEDDKKLITGFLIYGLMNVDAPNPILLVRGEQGTGKTFTTELLTSILAPSVSSLRMLPSNHDSLVLLAANNRVCAFDNVSYISDKLSDSLCTISTGITAALRGYSGGNTLARTSCSVIVNSINDVVRRPDLLDRTVSVLFKKIDEEFRVDTKTLSEAFNMAKPRIMGALFDGVVSALRNQNAVETDFMPRMADFAKTIAAAEEGLGWEKGSFLKAYGDNIVASAKEELENNVLARAVLLHMNQKQGVQEHTATEWVREIQRTCQYQPYKMQLPVSPISLSNELARIAPLLRTGGIEVERIKSNGSRSIRISKIPGAWSPEVQEEKFGRYLSPAPKAHARKSKPSN